MYAWREPRVLWSVVSERTDSVSRPRTLRFDREHFRVYDAAFEAHYLLVAPINYLFDALVPSVAPPLPFWMYQNDASAALRRARLTVGLAHRNVLSFTPFATPGALQGVWDRRLSTAWWQFDYGLTVTTDDAIEVELGVHHSPLNIDPPEGRRIPAVLAFDEQNELHPYGRINRVQDVVVLSSSSPQPAFDFDNYNAASAGVLTPGQLFDQAGAGKFSAGSFRKQRAISASQDRAQLTRFSAHIGSASWEAQLQTELGAVVNFADSVPSSLFNRVPIRAKHVAGGLEKHWWREGAPASLVFPTFGPALRHRFPKPLELKLGEAVDFELVIPPADAPVESFRVQVGVSLVGYAKPGAA